MRHHGMRGNISIAADVVSSSLAVGRGGAPLDVAHFDEAPFGVHVKENPQITDATAKGGGLVLQLHDVPGEGVASHLIEGTRESLPLRPRRALDAFSRRLSYP